MHLTRLSVRFAIVLALLTLFTLRLAGGGNLPIAPHAIPIGAGRYAIQTAGAIWWVLLALSVGAFGALVDALLNHFRSFKGRDRASFAVHAISIVAFVIAALGMASFVFELPVSALFATSSVVAVVFGFAMQSTLADLMSGLAISIEQPFRVGEWIAVGENNAGQVVEMNWRATRIKLGSGDFVIYPNSMLTRTRIINYDSPSRRHRVNFEIKLDNDEAPSHASDVLRAATLSAEGVLRAPPPIVLVSAFGDWSITYKVLFWIEAFDNESTVLSNVLTNIWTHLSWAGLSRPLPRSVVALERSHAGDECEELGRLLARMSVFAALTESELLQLAGALRPIFVPHGKRFITQGDLGRSLFIVREGLFGVRVMHEGTELQVAELRPGDYFGEASLLTGAPRNASVEALTDGAVFELDKEAVAPILAQRSEVADELARALAEHETARHDVSAKNGAPTNRGTLAEAAGRIRAFLLR